MRENRASAGKQTKVMNGGAPEGVRVESYMKSPTRRIPMRSSTPVRNGHTKREKQQAAESRKGSPRSSSLISRRKKLSETSENEKPVEPEFWLQPDTYDLLNTDLVHIKRSLMCLSRILAQNEEGEEEIAKESNGHHKTDSEERTLRDLKEKVLLLQRESEEKNKMIESLRNEINIAKHSAQAHVSYATKATQTEDLLDVYNNNSNGHDENAKHLVSRTVSDTSSHKSSSSKFSKVPLPWRNRSNSSTRRK